jgi:uncharacterized protein (TIGR00251 family)
VLEVVESGDGVLFSVRVQPRASRDAIVGEWQGALKIRLAAPPVDDRANQALRRLLAEHLEIPVAAVRILSGERSRTKRVEVRGVSAAQVLALVRASGPKAPEGG